jgi:hypothetical protein
MTSRLYLPLFLSLTLIPACTRSKAQPTEQKSERTAPSVASQTVPPTPQPVKLRPAEDETSFTVPPQAMTVTSVARRFLAQTRYMTVAELEGALRGANHLPEHLVWLKPQTTLTVPGVEPQPIVETPRHDPTDMEIRAIYLTGATAGSPVGLRMVEHWQQVGGNAVVFDIKDSDGTTSVPFDHPLAPHNHHAIENLPKYIRWLHNHQMHAIARIALFRDEHIARDFPRLAVQSRSGLASANVATWRENGKLVWTDTSHPEVQDYNLALAKFVAASGVDEVQFDYVRFPAEGDQKDAKWVFQSTHPDWQRSDVLVDFLSRAYKELHAAGVTLSLDVFGVMAWQRDVDLAHTGQDIARIAKYADVLSPMIYPSHFFNMDGYTGHDGHAMPGDAPEHFIAASMQRFSATTAGTGVVLRPWLQAFGWKTKTYSPEYVMTQIKVSKANDGIGFLLWNARNDYSKPYVAMEQMGQSPAAYFETAATLASKRKIREEQVAAFTQKVAPKTLPVKSAHAVKTKASKVQQ